VGPIGAQGRREACLLADGAERQNRGPRSDQLAGCSDGTQTRSQTRARLAGLVEVGTAEQMLDRLAGPVDARHPAEQMLDRLAGPADARHPAEWMLDRLAGLAEMKRLPLQGPSGRRVRRPVMKSRGSLLLRWL